MIASEFGRAVLGAYPRAVTVGLVLAALALVTAALPSRARTRLPSARFGRVAAACGLAALGALAVLATTAFVATLRGEALHGWALFAHASAGGAFAVLLAVTALATLAPALRVGPLRTLSRLAKCSLSGALACGGLATASILACTFPLVGTQGLARLLDVHRWSGLGAFVLAVSTAALIVRDRRSAVTGPRAS